jgi:geranylgeranyl pyrophosphate synthase
VSRDTLQAWQTAARARVEAALERWLPADAPFPAVLTEAMRYSLLAGGKRLRPLLTLAAADACAPASGLEAPAAERLAMPAACALEFIHTYSLVHDDLPSMDNDTLRRGRPTLHVVHGEAMAILAGDGLLTEAFALLAREPHDGPADLDARRLRVVRLLAESAGADGMVGGQVVDLQAVAADARPLDASGLRAMHARKTGALIRAAGVAGAVMAGGAAAHVDAVAAYGTHVGLAFQIVDDILDVEGDSADLGKTAGKDAAAGKPTYPALYGLEESKRLAARCVDEAIAALAAAGLGGHLPDLARQVVSRTH